MGVRGEDYVNSINTKTDFTRRSKDCEYFGCLGIYLRNWICEAFTGILGKNVILYVWDVLILNRWSEDIFAKVCIKVLFGRKIDLRTFDFFRFAWPS